MLTPNEENKIREEFGENFPYFYSMLPVIFKDVEDWLIDFLARFREREGEKDDRCKICGSRRGVHFCKPLEKNTQPKEQPSELSQCCGGKPTPVYQGDATYSYKGCNICGEPFIPRQEKEINSFSPDEFSRIMNNLIDLHHSKNHDYSGGEYLSDLIASNKLGITPWKNALLRMQQKMSRLESFAKQGQFKVENEKFEDTCKDLAVYAIICLMLYREKK